MAPKTVNFKKTGKCGQGASGPPPTLGARVFPQDTFFLRVRAPPGLHPGERASVHLCISQ